MKASEKSYFFTKYEICPKITLHWQAQGPCLGEAIYVSLLKIKSEIGSMASELNKKLWKTGVLPHTLLQSPRVLNHSMLQIIDFGVMFT